MDSIKTLSLVIPCYNEEKSLVSCIERCLDLKTDGLDLELVIVDDCSKDSSLKIAEDLASKYQCIKVFHHEVNQGKGAALRTGLEHATGDFVGIQDADSEYDPHEYLNMIEPILSENADVVYGSRFLKKESRRVLNFWHSMMNRGLTFLSNLFTDLDITDMETCYKLFSKEAIAKIAPSLKENRFGFEPEVTQLVAQNKFRVYECAIEYEPRSYNEGKKIGWKDGVRALYCILHYGAPYAPIPMQFIIYSFIGLTCAIANIFLFSIGLIFNFPISSVTIFSFILASGLNYLLCISILFRHRSRWNTYGELLLYVLTILIMGVFDYGCTYGFIYVGVDAFWSKSVAAALGLLGNFLLRKFLVF